MVPGDWEMSPRVPREFTVLMFFKFLKISWSPGTAKVLHMKLSTIIKIQQRIRKQQKTLYINNFIASFVGR